MQTIKMSYGGRVVIPAGIREALHIHQGDELFCEVRNGELVLASKEARIRHTREAFYSALPENARQRSLVDELLAERREEARRGE